MKKILSKQTVLSGTDSKTPLNNRVLPRRRATLLLSGVAVIGMIAGYGRGYAADFIVDTPTVVTNGGVAPANLANSDNITVTSSGSIAVGASHGIFATNQNNIIVNNGSISTNGGNSHGVRAAGFNTITNNGSIVTNAGNSDGIRAINMNGITNTDQITTFGNNGDGIQVNNINTVSNDGQIVTSGNNADGIEAINANTITNSGSIATDGSNSFGVRARNRNTVTNNGAITVDGIDSDGIRVVDDNFVANSGTIITTSESSYGISVDDDNTVINSGSIATDDNYSDGIYADNRNTITNSGTITTDGNESYGIRVYNDNTVTNSGSITTEGNYSHGIYADNRNTITNSGSITTEGAESYGIFAEDDNTVTNGGIITTDDDNSDGIRVDDDNLVNNSGTITTFGDSSDGIHSDNRNIVINSGSIFTNDNDADGIDVNDNNIVSNSGVIFVDGSGADGIKVDEDNVVTNSGQVISVSGRSFNFDDDGNTLNLLAPSFIGGEIELGGGTGTTVNIVTGPSHSVLWDFSTGTMAGGMPNISGSVPWFYDAATQKFAIFDPTVLAAAPTALMDVTGLLSAVMQRRLEAGELSINGVNRGSSNGAGDEGNTYEGGAFDKSGVWLKVLGSYSKQEEGEATQASTTTLAGFAAGFDTNLNPSTRLGLMAGYLDGKFEAENRFTGGFSTDQSGWFAAGYGRKAFGTVFVDVGVSAGVNTGTGDDTMRFVNDNLAPLGESYATSGGGGNSFWISPEVTIGSQIATSSSWTLSPTAKLRYAAQWLGGYTETGASPEANAIVSDRMV
ncbi:MAG: autotransporter domain-containing protein, partial [Hyphomicrobiales bacterium]